MYLGPTVITWERLWALSIYCIPTWTLWASGARERNSTSESTPSKPHAVEGWCGGVPKSWVLALRTQQVCRDLGMYNAETPVSSIIADRLQ